MSHLSQSWSAGESRSVAQQNCRQLARDASPARFDSSLPAMRYVQLIRFRLRTQYDMQRILRLRLQGRTSLGATLRPERQGGNQEPASKGAVPENQLSMRGDLEASDNITQRTTQSDPVCFRLTQQTPKSVSKARSNNPGRAHMPGLHLHVGIRQDLVGGAR